MEFSLVLLNKLISMSLMAVVGYVMVKVGTLKQEDSRVISLLLLFVIQPCMILRSLQIELTPDRLQGFLFATVASSLSMLFCILFAKLFQKVWDLDPVDRTSLTYANVGNLILPLISMSLGDEMVFYGSTFQVPFNLLLWTHCYSLFMGGKRLKLKKMLTNPPLIALGLGLFLLVTQLHLPGVIDTAAKGYHDMVAAASMLLVGMIIAGSDLKSVFTYKKAYLSAAGDLHPAAVCQRLCAAPSRYAPCSSGSCDRRRRSLRQLYCPDGSPRRQRRYEGKHLQCHVDDPVRSHDPDDDLPVPDAHRKSAN